MSATNALALALTLLVPARPDVPAAPPRATRPVTEAERVARLQRGIEEDKKYLLSLQTQLKDPKSEFVNAGKWFENVDAALQNRYQEIRKLRREGREAEIAAGAAADKDLKAKWQRARERFDLAIQEHKTLQETAATLEAKIKQDQQALAQLLQAVPALGSPAAGPAPSGQDPGKPAPAAAPSHPQAGAATPAASRSETAEPPVAAPGQDKALDAARAEARQKEQQAQQAEDKAKSVSERIQTLQANITLAGKLLETARKRADDAEQTKARFDKELQEKLAANAPKAELQGLGKKIDWAQKRIDSSLAEVRTTTDRLHELQASLNSLQAEQITVLREADLKKREAEAAQGKVTQLQNPFDPHNLLQWGLHHGPKLVLIVVGIFLLRRLAWLFSSRVVEIMARGHHKRGSRQDRENRAQTLVGVFRNSASLLILVGGLLMALDEVGIPIMPLMGGAAVIGLAVAFGAQNLIRDYFSGFMVLVEDQYGINDVVQIGSVSGTVEHISLRMTVLRDLEGIVHFIPHGTITTVSNMTHGWSRALFKVAVAYREDVDRALRVLKRIANEMRQDPQFARLILEEPEMLGVNELTDSAMVIKFFIKTLPLHQWEVKREMLRRIKKAFDAMQIELPYARGTSPSAAVAGSLPPAKAA